MGVTTAAKQRSLGSLRRSLMIRSGAAAGASFGYEIFDEFLKDAQRQLYTLVDWKHLVNDNIQPVNIGEKWYDLPDDCDLERILSVTYRINGSSRWNGAMSYGIPLALRSVNINGYPYLYETRNNHDAPSGVVNPVQIELYPVVQKAGQLRVEYVKKLQPFESDNDTATLPDDLILLHALYNSKSHFNRPDAQSIASQLEAMLGRARSQHRKISVVHRAPVNGMLPEDLSYLYPPV